MRVPLTPYSVGEFVPMVWRRFTPPPPRPAGRACDLRLEDTAPERWIGFVGDVCPLSGRSARFGPEVQRFLAPCNLLVGNFEGVLTERRWLPFKMKHAEATFDALARLAPLERWVLSVANNHAADFGPAALAGTLRAMERRGIRWVGTRDQPHLRIDSNLTVTAWTWWSNRRTDAVARHDPGAPTEAGVHVALPHWGYEHERQPRPEQAPPPGYALTAGHHSHLPQPFEALSDGRLVAWSLGNFITGKRLRVLGEGAMLKIGLARPGSGAPVITRASFRPLTLDRSDPRLCRVLLHDDA